MAGTNAGKSFAYSQQDPRLPAQYWFQDSTEGTVLFAVFYTLSCRWNRCLGCNLPSKSSATPVTYRDIIAQVDTLFGAPEVRGRLEEIRKLIVSNNGAVLDQRTFPTTALMYLLVKSSLLLTGMRVLALETRPENVEWEELELLARALRERERPADLEIAIGFEAFDERIRNQVFRKGLALEQVEDLAEKVARYGYALKCYFMLKPVPGLDDEAAVRDIHAAIDYLDGLAERHKLRVNMHLNPTFVAAGTPIEDAFRRGEYTPPLLADAARAAQHARGKRVSVFLGLYDEGLAVPGGSFVRTGDEALLARLAEFNRTQDFGLLG